MTTPRRSRSRKRASGSRPRRKAEQPRRSQPSRPSRKKRRSNSRMLHRPKTVYRAVEVSEDGLQATFSTNAGQKIATVSKKGLPDVPGKHYSYIDWEETYPDTKTLTSILAEINEFNVRSPEVEFCDFYDDFFTGDNYQRDESLFTFTDFQQYPFEAQGYKRINDTTGEPLHELESFLTEKIKALTNDTNESVRVFHFAFTEYIGRKGEMMTRAVRKMYNGEPWAMHPIDPATQGTASESNRTLYLFSGLNEKKAEDLVRSELIKVQEERKEKAKRMRKEMEASFFRFEKRTRAEDGHGHSEASPSLATALAAHTKKRAKQSS